MIQLKLSDVEIGTLSERSVSNGQFRKHNSGEAKNIFLNQFANQSLSYQTDNLYEPNGGILYSTTYHRNYMEYLAKCWSDHLGAIFSPDILWNTLLAELASIVKEDAETYRCLFTDSDEKKDVSIPTGDPRVIPLDTLMIFLREKIPNDTSNFLPEFTTSTTRSKHAFYANFADMCSPYYNYMMYMCDIPKIEIRGQIEDYLRIKECWNNLATLFKPKQAYIDSISNVLENICDRLEDVDFWKKMFSLERCGSGGQVQVNGWWTQIYRKLPEGPRYPENYSSHVAKVNYRNLQTKIDYSMFNGLFYSKMIDDYLVPDFGFIVYENKSDSQT